MPKISPKIIFATLLGIVFLLGGAGVAMAEGWTFHYLTTAAPSVDATYSPPFATKPLCDAQKATYAADTATYGTVYPCTGSDIVATTGTSGTSGTALTAGAGGAGATTDVYMFGTNSTRYPTKSACEAAMGTNGPCIKISTQLATGTINTGDATMDFLINSWKCSLTDMGSCLSSLLLAGPTILLYEIYKIASWLLIACAYFMDNILSWSIEGPLINPPPAFIDSLWAVVRDFSNMLFIFILLYTGIMTMFGEKDWKRTILWVVVMALLINFSLFFTKVVIDAGNILAVGIKSSLASGGKSISGELAKAFAPQSFVSTAGAGSMSDAMIIFAVAIIVNGYAAYIFFKVAILFSRRLIVFWALMILSPFAFISIALPEKLNKFHEWLDALTSLSFVAPIFLFFLYLIIQVINAPGPGGKLLDLLKTPTTTFGEGLLVKILGPVMIAALLVKALQEALKFTENFAGTVGAEFSGLVSGAMGMAGGAALAGATGGASLLAQKTVGKFAASKLAGGELKEGSWQHSLATRASTASFDMRNISKEGFIGGKINKGLGAFGIDAQKGVGSWGAKSGKGGYAAYAQRKEDTDMAGAEKAELTDGEKKTINAKYGVEDKEAEAKKQEQQVAERAELVATAEKNKKDAEIAAQNSTAGQAIAGAQTQLDTQTKAAQKAKEVTQKATAEREAAQKAIGTALDPAGAQKTLEGAILKEQEAVLKEQEAVVAVESAQTAVDNATTTYSADIQKNKQAIESANQALTSAKKDLADAQKRAQTSATEAKGARSTAAKEITNENERRRVEYAEKTSGGAPHTWFNNKAKQDRIDKIRKGRTPDEKAKAKARAEKEGKEASEKAEQAKLIKALAKQLKENDGGGKEKKEDKEKEGGSH